MNALAAAATGGNMPAWEVILGVVAYLAIAAAYLAPTITALLRHMPSTGPIIVINILLGWTVIGWIIALAMAVRSKPARTA